jgi:hypothetical protein
MERSHPRRVLLKFKIWHLLEQPQAECEGGWEGAISSSNKGVIRQKKRERQQVWGKRRLE